jgi:hypothetical protein
MSTCIPIPTLDFPEAIPGISLCPTLPELEAEVPNVCCLLPGPIGISVGVILPPLTVNAAFLEPIFTTLDNIQAKIVALIPKRCPRS